MLSSTPAYLQRVFASFSKLFDPATRPDGALIFAVAENCLNFAPLRDRMKRNPPLPQYASQYASMRGTPEFRASLARFLSVHLMGDADGKAVSPDDLSAASGCGAVLSLLALALCDAGDVVLIPSPTYAGFGKDLSLTAGVQPRYVPVAGPTWALSRASLDAAAAAAAAAGQRVRAVLLTTPSNPQGLRAGAAEVEEVLSWCRDRSVHLISDEVYALGVYGGAEQVTEASVAAAGAGEGSVARACERLGLCERAEGSLRLPPWVHVVYGFSKDWGVSGFRVGAVWSSHAGLQQAWEEVGYFHAVSNAIQADLAAVLDDDAFAAAYLRQNAALCGARARRVEATLAKFGCPCVRPEAGMFVWADLRPLLARFRRARGGAEAEDGHPFAGERRLFEALCDEAGVVATPGESCFAAEEGFFRFCVAWVPDEGMEELERRLRTFSDSLDLAAAGK